MTKRKNRGVLAPNFLKPKNYVTMTSHDVCLRLNYNGLGMVYQHFLDDFRTLKSLSLSRMIN